MLQCVAAWDLLCHLRFFYINPSLHVNALGDIQLYLLVINHHSAPGCALPKDPRMCSVCPVPGQYGRNSHAMMVMERC